jgi:hypothetical protein
MRLHGMALACVACFGFSFGSAAAADVQLSVEAGAVWQQRNDVRIPGDDGTRFALDEITGSGPFGFGRLSLHYDFADRHGVRLIYAPLRLREDGALDQGVDFAGASFAPGNVEATYQFNAHRLTYRYRWIDEDRWGLRVGFTGLVRDAEVRLRQDGLSARDTDVGFVPLLHLAGHYRLNDRWRLAFDFDGLAAPQGRAFDIGVRAEYALSERWDLLAGFRMLDGGVDNDDVFNFARFNYVVIGVAYRAGSPQ